MYRAVPLKLSHLQRFSLVMGTVFLLLFTSLGHAAPTGSGKQLTAGTANATPSSKAYGVPITLSVALKPVSIETGHLPNFKKALQGSGPVYIWCFGSSVGAGATLPDPSTQAPCPYFASILKTKFDPSSTAHIIVENYSVNGSTWSTFPSAWATALASGHTPSICYFAYGMNDFPMSQYNSSEGLSGSVSFMYGAMANVKAIGADLVVATTPHMSTVNYPDSDYKFFEGNPGFPEVYPVYIPGPVQPDQIYPSVANSVVPVTYDSSGPDVMVDFRFIHGNELERIITRDAGGLLVDAEAYWLESISLLTKSLGSQSAAEYQVFAPGNYNHPGLYGHQHSYWPAAEAAIASIDTTQTAVPIGGTVEFLVDGQSAGKANVAADGSASLSTQIKPGVRSITSRYSGDANNLASMSADMFIVSRGDASLVVNTPTLHPAVGTGTTLVAVASGAAGTVPPQGSVKFMDGPAVLGTATLDSNGVASLTTAALAFGSHTITATFDGDENFNGATSSVLPLTVAASSTTTALSATNQALNSGDSTILNVHVTSPQGTPVGTVSFTSNGSQIGTATLDANGTASLTVSSLPVGNNQIVASYQGTVLYPASSSSPLVVVVNPADFSLSNISTNLGVVSGQSAVMSFHVNAVGNFNALVSFSCSDLPALASCSFSPASVTPAAGGTSVTLTLKTQQANSYIQAAGIWMWGALLLGIGFARKRRSVVRGLLLCILSLGMGFALTGCAGGGSSAPKSTVPGTYVVKVTATAGAITHTASVTLSVTQ